jgi:hypothetical protein
MIILTQVETEQLCGPPVDGQYVMRFTGDDTALHPVLLLDGTFVLPEDVLTDPAHAAAYDALSVLPTREVAEDEYPPLNFPGRG